MGSNTRSVGSPFRFVGLVVEFLLPLILLTAAIWGLFFARKLTPLVFGILVIIIGSIFGPEFYSVKAGPLPLTVDRALWGVLLGMVAIMILRRRDGLPAYSPVDFYLLAFLLVVGFSTMTHDWSADGNAALARYLFFQAMPISFFWIGRHLKVTEDELFKFAILGTGFGIYLALTGIAEKFGVHGIVFPRYIITNENVEFFGRARGPFINPIGNGIAQIFCLGCAALLWQAVEHKFRGAVSVLIGLICVGVIFTMTRSVWLSLIVCSAFTVWFTFPAASRGMLVTSGAIAVVLFVLVLSPYANKFKRDKDVTADEMSQSVGLRPMLFSVAFDMAKDRPLTGHGYGQYKAEAGPYHLNGSWGMPLQKVRKYVQHNVFLAYLAELGLIGLGLTIIVLGCFISNAYEVLQERSSRRCFRFVGLIALFLSTAIIVNGCFHDVSLIVMAGSIFYFANGLAYSVRDQIQAKGKMNERCKSDAEPGGDLVWS